MGYDYCRYARKVGTNLVLKDPEAFYPKITLYSSGNTILDLGGGAYMTVKQGGANVFKYTYAGNVSTIEGGGVTGDDLKLKANTIDATPFILLEGNGDITLAPDVGSHIRFGQYSGGAASDSIGYISVKDAAGNARKLMVQA